jgi:hypothetical protein
MKYIDNNQVLSLLQTHKVTAVDSRKVANDTFNNNVWEIDVMVLDNGQAIGIEGDGGSVSYWLVEAADFKDRT